MQGGDEGEREEQEVAAERHAGEITGSGGGVSSLLRQGYEGQGLRLKWRN